MNKPLVYIVILNYKNYDDTIECVHSVEAINYLNCRVVIVDNNSCNGSEEILKKKFPRHIFIQNERNLGYAAGNNAGIRVALNAHADYIMILNNDTLVKVDFLEILVAYAEFHPNVGILGPKIIDESGDVDNTCARRRPEFLDYFFRVGPGKWIFPNNEWIRTHYYLDEYDFVEAKEVDILSGSCLLFRGELLQKIGLFDENTFLYLEEFILHEKLRKTQYTTVVLPSSSVLHKKHGSTGTKNYKATFEVLKSSKYYLWNYRNFGNIANTLALMSIGFCTAASILRIFIASNCGFKNHEPSKST